MYKIGILGSDNSHALAFSKLVNIPDPATGEYLYPDIRITGIYGHDSEQTEKVATEGQLILLLKNRRISRKVDAVMVVFRHGDLHAKYALPFIRQASDADRQTVCNKHFRRNRHDRDRNP